jgi:hypothetical protein
MILQYSANILERVKRIQLAVKDNASLRVYRFRKEIIISR